MTRSADTDDLWTRELARLLLRRVGYAEARRVLEEEAGGSGAPKKGRRRVRSFQERAELATAELVRERARRVVGDD